jgi:SNF2 family DNA or RNA helicase
MSFTGWIKRPSSLKEPNLPSASNASTSTASSPATLSSSSSSSSSTATKTAETSKEKQISQTCKQPVFVILVSDEEDLETFEKRHEKKKYNEKGVLKKSTKRKRSDLSPGNTLHNFLPSGTNVKRVKLDCESRSVEDLMGTTDINHQKDSRLDFVQGSTSINSIKNETTKKGTDLQPHSSFERKRKNIDLKEFFKPLENNSANEHYDNNSQSETDNLNDSNLRSKVASYKSIIEQEHEDSSDSQFLVSSSDGMEFQLDIEDEEEEYRFNNEEESEDDDLILIGEESINGNEYIDNYSSSKSHKKISIEEYSEKRMTRKRVMKDSYILLANGWNYDKQDDEYVIISNDIIFPVRTPIYQQLYNYQREGVKWLVDKHLAPNMNGGILADDMGLGKTIQTCAFIEGLFSGKIGCRVMIVSPVSVLLNWKKELKKWSPAITKIFQFYKLTSAKSRIDCLNKFESRARTGNGAVLLTTYGMITAQIQLLKTVFKDVIFDTIILDEGHKIKNRKTAISQNLKALKAKTKFVLTGTPIQNRLSEMWSLYDWIFDNKLLGNQVEFSEKYERYIVNGNKRDATPAEKVHGNERSLALRNLIKPYFLRREKHKVLKSQDKSAEYSQSRENKKKYIGASTNFQATISQKNDLILWIYLSKKQEEVYRAYLNSEDVHQVLNKFSNPLASLNVLKQICDHHLLLKDYAQLSLPSMEPSNSSYLSIDLMKAPVISHGYDIANADISSIVRDSAKLQVMCNLLSCFKRNGHRTLIFSQYAKMLDIIERVLKEKLCFRFLRIDGTISSAKERQTRVDKFNSDKRVDCFILTSTVGGIGLNLTGANRVIIFDPSWNPAIDNQSVDRAYRIGQKENVVVYRLVTCATIEEKIYRKQVFKGGLSKTAIDKENQYRYFSQSDLQDLFTLGDTKVSKTQIQLEKIHSDQRKTYAELEKHIEEITTWKHVSGVSDHDLLFAKEADDDLTNIEHEHPTLENTVVMQPSLEQLLYIQQLREKQRQEKEGIRREREYLLSQDVIDIDSYEEQELKSPNKETKPKNKPSVQLTALEQRSQAQPSIAGASNYQRFQQINEPGDQEPNGYVAASNLTNNQSISNANHFFVKGVLWTYSEWYSLKQLLFQVPKSLDNLNQLSWLARNLKTKSAIDIYSLLSDPTYRQRLLVSLQQHQIPASYRQQALEHQVQATYLQRNPMPYLQQNQQMQLYHMQQQQHMQMPYVYQPQQQTLVQYAEQPQYQQQQVQQPTRNQYTLTWHYEGPESMPNQFK